MLSSKAQPIARSALRSRSASLRLPQQPTHAYGRFASTSTARQSGSGYTSPLLAVGGVLLATALIANFTKGSERKTKALAALDTANATARTPTAVTKKADEAREILPSAEQQDADPKDQAFDPVTGEINWDCPCLGGMAEGPCGEDFKTAFSCFIYSEEEPKGVNCIEAFKTMQDCFRKNPEIYADHLADDDDDEDEAEHASLLENVENALAESYDSVKSTASSVVSSITASSTAREADSKDLQARNAAKGELPSGGALGSHDKFKEGVAATRSGSDKGDVDKRHTGLRG